METTEFRIVREDIWDGKIGEFDLVFEGDIFENRSLIGFVRPNEIFESIETYLDNSIEQAFPNFPIEVKLIEIDLGSLRITVALFFALQAATATGVTTFNAMKDYENFRKGVTMFVEDVKKHGPDLLDTLTTFMQNKEQLRLELMRQENDQNNRIGVKR